MSVIKWIIFGIFAGLIARSRFYKSGGGLHVDIALGICGAIVGGFIESRLGIGSPGTFGLNVPNLLISFLGAITFLLIYHEFAK